MNFGYRRWQTDDDDTETVSMQDLSNHARARIYSSVIEAQVLSGNPSLPPSLTLAFDCYEVSIKAVPLYTGRPLGAFLLQKYGMDFEDVDYILLSQRLDSIRERLAWEGVSHIEKMYEKWSRSGIKPQIDRAQLDKFKTGT